MIDTLKHLIVQHIIHSFHEDLNAAAMPMKDSQVCKCSHCHNFWTQRALLSLYSSWRQSDTPCNLIGLERTKITKLGKLWTQIF